MKRPVIVCMLFGKRIFTKVYRLRTSSLTSQVSSDCCNGIHTKPLIHRQCGIRLVCHLQPLARSELPVRAPLLERPFSFEASLQDVTSWFEKAKLLIKAEIKDFNQSEDPSEEELLVISCFRESLSFQ